MDRSIIVPYRAEEKELSQVLYSAIQGLMLIYPPTEELRKCLSDEMFIKPNQQAFFHVMHYLFRILDAQEFKKRFFWPITDKRSESNFRTSTVEYLKHINDKHQLNWSNIKSYLVVMPGGMKFIGFLLDFINFIVQELMKQKEKQLNLDVNSLRTQVSESNVTKLWAKNEFFKGMASQFVDALENVSSEYEAKSQKLMQHLETLSQETGLSLDLLTDEKFLKSFDDSNQQLYDQFYSCRSEKVLEMENSISQLKEAMEKFYSKETGYKYDKQRVCQQLKQIQNHFHIEESLGPKVAETDVNINTLIMTFNAIAETIQKELNIFNQKEGVGKTEFSALMSLRKELHEIETQITSFKKILNENEKKSKLDSIKTPARSNINDPKKVNLENNLLMKLVSTPPIKFELPESGGKSRLALVDTKAVHINETNFNNFLAPPSAMALRQSNRTNSLLDRTISELNNTYGRSKIIDPMQLLRSTSKKDSSKSKTTTPQLNISNLGIKWKQRQCILNEKEENAFADNILPIHVTPEVKTCPKLSGINKACHQPLNQTTSATILNQSPLTPFNSKDHTRIAKPQSQLDSSSSKTLSLVPGKKLFAVKKVQDASLNFSNLSTSPSGRLEPLVTANDVPKLKVNDITIGGHNLSSDNSIFAEVHKLLLNSVDSNVTLKDGEIEADANNSGKDNKHILLDIYDKEEDALSNISDSVLKDLTL